MIKTYIIYPEHCLEARPTRQQDMSCNGAPEANFTKHLFIHCDSS